MNITEHELAKFRGIVVQIKAATDVPTKLRLLREASDALQLAISCLEEPHPNDNRLRMALFALFDSVKLHDNGWYGLTNRENFNWSLKTLFTIAGYITEAANDP